MGKTRDDPLCSQSPDDELFLSCSLPEFTDRLEFDLQYVWERYGARQRWCKVMKMLRSVDRDEWTFNYNRSRPSQRIAQYLRYTNPPSFNCGIDAQSGCAKDTECIGDLDAPGSLILDSLYHLSDVSVLFHAYISMELTTRKVFEKMYKGWDASLLHASPYSNNLRSHFAPERKKDKGELSLKLVLDIVGIGFLVASHGSWHNVSTNLLALYSPVWHMCLHDCPQFLKPTVKAFVGSAKERAEKNGKKAAESALAAAERTKMTGRQAQEAADKARKEAYDNTIRYSKRYEPAA